MVGSKGVVLKVIKVNEGAQTFLCLNSFNIFAMTIARTATVQGVQRMYCYNKV
jgi:hypothetical protein